MKSETLLNQLNEQQKESVITTEGPVCVLAGAGAGKTRALTFRTAYLINEELAKPEQILSVTFTNKAASEMKERIIKLVPGLNEIDLNISTFHSFCVKLLRRFIQVKNYNRGFIIIDDDDKEKILKAIIKDLKLKDIKIGEVYNFIAAQKMKLDYIEEECNLKDVYDINTAIYYKYLLESRRQNYIDYDDILAFALYTLQKNKEALAFYQNKFKYIQVDEFQDTCQIQYELIKLLCANNNLFVVGDMDQSIYKFRGAVPNIFFELQKDYKDLKIIIMDVNYRSCSEIISASNKLIKNNANRIEKTLKAARLDKGEFKTYCCEKSFWQSSQVKRIIDKLINSGYEYSDIAVLYRNNSSSRYIEDMCVKHQIPYIIYNTVSFYKKVEIKDLLAYVRFSLSKSDIDFMRIYNIPKRGLGLTWLNGLREKAIVDNISLYEELIKVAENKTDKKAIDLLNVFNKIDTIVGNSNSLDGMLKAIINEINYLKYLEDSYSDYDNRLEYIKSLLISMHEFDEQYFTKYPEPKDINEVLENYFTELALINNDDNKEEKKNSIKLMTVHASKGLEFRAVIVIDFINGIFPKITKESEELEEERRVAYVALTRAKDYCHLLSYKKDDEDLSSIFIKESKI